MPRKPNPAAWGVAATVIAVLALGGTAIADAAARPAAPAVRALRTGLETLERQVQEFTLANGLRFLVVERHQAPVFSFFTVVNTGSNGDRTGTTGLAHMMEHMAFKGTSLVGTSDYSREKPLLDSEERAWSALLDERRKGARADSARLAQLEKSFAGAQEASRQYVVSNEYSKIIEEAGGQNMNAFTAQDITAYFFSLPSNRLELWAATFAGSFVDPVFREFYKERDVVYEERRMRVESSPIGRLYYEFITTAFNAHPYGFGGIGYPSDLKSFSRTQGEEFFRRNYVAKNMTVVVVGDVKVDEVKRLAQKYFSSVSDAPAPPPIDTVEPQQIAERRVIIEDKAQPFVFAGWHIPAASDPRYAAYKAAADLLGGGHYSRLYKTLVKEKKMAVQVGMGTGEPGEAYPNLMMLYIVPASGQDPEALEREAYRILDEAMSAKPFTVDELNGYKVRVRAAKIGAVDDNGQLAGELGQAQALYGGWREFFREQERVQALKLDDLASVLREALVKSNRTVGIMKNPVATTANEGGR